MEMENGMLTLEELNAHYKAVRARLEAPIIKKKEPPVRLVHSGPYPDPLDLPPPVVKVEEVKKVVIPAYPAPVETPSQKILSEVAQKHNMPPTVFRDPSREMAYVHCRQEAAHRLSDELGFSLKQIGRLFGGRDHTTVRNAIIRYRKNLALGGQPWTRKCVSDACDTEARTQAQHDHG